MTDYVQVFTSVYENRVWGDNRRQDYTGSSGAGSAVMYNIATYVPFLKGFIAGTGAKSVADLGCGDFRCGKLIYDDLDVSYHGYDAYGKVVDSNRKEFAGSAKYEFTHLDFCNNWNDIAPADLCVIKDVLQHWELSSVYAFLDSVVASGKFKKILICNCSNQTEDDTDVPAGGWRPLSAAFLPLKKYGARVAYRYGTKEVSVIDC